MEGQLRILSMWAFIALDGDGTEGVVSVELPGVGQMPLVGADLAMVAKLRPLAVQTARQTGATITLAHFDRRTDAETITPETH